MKNNITKNNKGFTLVEIMVAISIFSLISFVAISCLLNTVSGVASGSGKVGAVSNVSIAMQRLCNDIRAGKSVSISTGGLYVVFPSKSTDPVTGEVIYNLSANDPYPRRYYISGNMLKRQYGSSITTIGKNISEASFGASGGNITITLKSKYQVGSKISSQTLNERIILRNYRANQ